MHAALTLLDSNVCSSSGYCYQSGAVSKKQGAWLNDLYLRLLQTIVAANLIDMHSAEFKCTLLAGEFQKVV